MGGTRLTIIGNGFTNEKSHAQVFVGGDSCDVQIATMTQIECVLAPRGATTAENGTSFVQGALQPGSRGVRRRVWWQAGSENVETFRNGEIFNSNYPDVDELEMSILESTVNLLNERGDEWGPQMQYRGFFRAPVTVNYSFLVPSDDDAKVWVGSLPNTASEMELLINFGRWTFSRQWDRELWGIGRYHNPIDKIFNRMPQQRALRQIHLHEGEFLYLDAHYRSGKGADNFALAVVQHNSTVNRKDVPSGIDEKQLIDIAVPRTEHEVHRVTLKGNNLAGTFRLSLGGKHSRAIMADASAADVSAAVREMLSNCEGDIGLPTDSAGNTFTCFSESGLTYRGLAHTTEQGDECIPWVETDYYDPWLVVMSGLDGNLCRNPDFRSSGPWCVNAQKQVRSCALQRCGGTEEQVKNTPGLSTFEDEEPNTEALPFTNSFEERDGVTPRVVKGDAFCGSGSLYFNNAWGAVKNSWRHDEGKDASYDGAAKGLYPFGTKKFPYICMGYKIPPTTRVNMLISIEHRDEEGVLTNRRTWKTIKLTHDKHHGSHFLIGQWPLTADDTWRYDCLDLQYMLDTASPEDDTLFSGQDHLVKDIIFWTNQIPTSSYSDDNFYIDEFSISQTIRAVKQSAYPHVPLRTSNSPLLSSV